MKEIKIVVTGLLPLTSLGTESLSESTGLVTLSNNDDRQTSFHVRKGISLLKIGADDSQSAKMIAEVLTRYLAEP